MGKTHSFKFLDKDLNRSLAGLLKKARIDHRIDKDGIVYYAADDEEVVDNVICSIRDDVFSPWKLLTCPSGWTVRYKDYMSRHGVPFTEELSNGEPWFLIPRKYRPHAWRLNGESTQKRPARAG